MSTEENNNSQELPEVDPDNGSTAEFEMPKELIETAQDGSNFQKKRSSLTLAWAAESDVGNVRSHNEDSYYAEPPLFIVCDGMGGHAGGDIASKIAIDEIMRSAPNKADDVALGKAIEKANTVVIEAVERGEGKPGMGTTATAAIIKNESMSVAHVGDSRCYILHKGALTRLTRDHSLVEEMIEKGLIDADEARSHPKRSIITRALGSDEEMYADHFTIPVTQGDRIMLCSDGLTSAVSDSQIEEVMNTTSTPQKCVDELIALALAGGGFDNITCLAIDVIDDKAQLRQRLSAAKNVLLWSASIILVLAIFAGALGLYSYNSWFLTTSGGNVAVAQGVPASFGSFHLYSVVDVTHISADELAETTQKRLKEGIRVVNRDAANSLILNYQEQIDLKREEQQKKEEEDEQAREEAERLSEQPAEPALPEEPQPTPPTENAPPTSEVVE